MNSSLASIGASSSQYLIFESSGKFVAGTAFKPAGISKRNSVPAGQYSIFRAVRIIIFRGKRRRRTLPQNGRTTCAAMHYTESMGYLYPAPQRQLVCFIGRL